MRRSCRAIFLILWVSSSLACEVDEPVQEESWRWDLPDGFPTPLVPADNPMSVAKVELGRHLFYDRRLSANRTFSCASCHRQELAFTDNRPRALGSTGEEHPRNSMSLTNVAYNSTFNWANPMVHSLEEQALTPLFGEDPVELGLASVEDEWLHRLRDDPVYRQLFTAAFSDGDGDEAEIISIDTVTKALAAFQRTLISGDAPYDHFIYGGQESALDASQRRGMSLFFSERLECFHCHGGFNFSLDVDHEGQVFTEPSFHNTGLYNYDHVGSYPPKNTGLYEFTGKPQDMGRFRAPTLRNIEVTAPYFHDGSADTLDEVIDHYAAGGRTLHSGPYPGDGSRNPFKSTFINGFTITAQEREDLKAFLRALTDETFITNPAYADPFED